MAVYKFRIVFEEHDDISRDIEIKPNQTFQDLHLAIQNSIKFDASKNASFYVSDDYWRKGFEIAHEKLSSVKIAQYIEDPHQKFIYYFDPQAKWTLNIELFKILPDEEGVKYPRCVKSVGDAPSQYGILNLTKGGTINPENNKEDEIDDSDFYKEPDNMMEDLEGADDEEARKDFGIEEEYADESDENDEFGSGFESGSDFEDEH
jgi:hypothetical protein